MIVFNDFISSCKHSAVLSYNDPASSKQLGKTIYSFSGQLQPN